MEALILHLQLCRPANCKLLEDSSVLFFNKGCLKALPKGELVSKEEKSLLLVHCFEITKQRNLLLH